MRLCYLLQFGRNGSFVRSNCGGNGGRGFLYGCNGGNVLRNPIGCPSHMVDSYWLKLNGRLHEVWSPNRSAALRHCASDRKWISLKVVLQLFCITSINIYASFQNLLNLTVIFVVPFVSFKISCLSVLNQQSTV